MLVIRNQQMQAFREAALTDFVKRMAAHLRQACPEPTRKLAEPELHGRIRAGIEKAEKFGVTDENDVRRYLEYVAELGPEFPDAPGHAWAAEILKIQDLSGTKKMNRIDDHHLFVLRPKPGVR